MPVQESRQQERQYQQLQKRRLPVQEPWPQQRKRCLPVQDQRGPDWRRWLMMAAPSLWHWEMEQPRWMH